MNSITKTMEPETANRVLDELREDVAIKQKCGLPFIIASVIIWGLIFVACRLGLPVYSRNMLVFCCSCPLMPIAMGAGKILHVDIFDKSNPLGKLGFLFTMNQMIYLLIVMWAFSAVPDKMVMVYAMVFGAHLLPYSWLYKTKLYIASAIVLPIAALVLEPLFSTDVMALCFMVFEIALSIGLFITSKKRMNVAGC